MPIDSSIPLGIKTPELPNPLVMALQGAMMRNQMLSGNNLQQSMAANQAVSQAIQHNTGTDGKVNLGGVQSELATNPAAAYNLQAATGQNLAQMGQQLGNQGQNISNVSAQLQQNLTRLGWMREQLGALATNPNAKLSDIPSVLAAGVQSGMLQPGQLLQVLNDPDYPQTPDQIKNWATRHLSTVDSVANQIQNMTPGGGSMNLGSTQKIVNVRNPSLTNQPVGGTVATFKNTLPPGAQASIVTDVAGNPGVVERNPDGSIKGAVSMPGAVTPGQGPGFQVNGYQGQPHDIAAFQQEVHTVRQQGDQAPIQHNINQQILKLVQNTQTGPGTPAWQKALAAVGAPLGLDLGTSSYQELGKYLEKNAIANMQAMGGAPSDARLSAAAAANGSTQFNPQALAEVTKFNDAATTGLEQYRQGMDKAVGLTNPNYNALAQFKSQWAKNMDVNIFRLDNAIHNGDRTEVNTILKGLSPQQRQQLAQKRLNLQTLATTGRLPQ
jgi:hypothetical protein